MIARRRLRRGYTLVELAAASAAFAVIVVLLLQWFGGLLASVAANNEISAAQRQYLIVAQQLRDDVSGAEACLPYGQDTPLARLSQGVLVLRQGPERPAVAWREDGGQLERAELAPCADDPTGAGWAGMLGVAEDSVTFVVRDRDGVSSDELGVCGTVLAGGCDPSSVTIRFDQTGRGGTDQARRVVAVR
jgi:prepilin-type N-terminal cleavage/methylation domain-containing protein